MFELYLAMKLLTLPALVAAWLAISLAGLGLFVGMNLDYARARFPGLRPVGEERFSLLTIYEGHVSATGAYWTGADLAIVWGWYRDRFQVETPAGDADNARAGCLSAVKTQQWAFIRRTFQATLCSRPPGGTSIFLYQTWRIAR